MSHQTLSLFIKILKALSKHSQSYAVITIKRNKIAKMAYLEHQCYSFQRITRHFVRKGELAQILKYSD